MRWILVMFGIIGVAALMGATSTNVGPEPAPVGSPFVTTTTDATLTNETTLSTAVVVDEAYDATDWNGDLTLPTKNAIRDKVETLSAGVTDATYITQTANGTLSAEQALSTLSTGVMKVTTTTGVISTAVVNTDFYGPSASIVLGANYINGDTTGSEGLTVDTSGNGAVTGTFGVNGQNDGGTGAKLFAPSMYTPGNIWATGGLKIAADATLTRVEVNSQACSQFSTPVIFGGSGGPMIKFVDANTLLVNNGTNTAPGSLTIANLYSSKAVVNDTDGDTWDADDVRGQIYTNTGAAGQTFNLPAAVAGMHFTVVLSAAVDVNINPDDADVILVLTNAAGDAISSDAAQGSRIELVAIDGTNWIALESAGTWSDVN
jgi:hypothetical protein